ncbi:MAG: hypothetical protein LBE02_01180 [Spirochaetaceae bacterium]|jgi:hypothetical protein|nr:hypothetical protein [Spirochaetaceae bacterium]
MGKQKAVYAPGELNNVRKRLGDLDLDEAKRMSQILGGEIGYERTSEQEASRKKRVRHETVEINIGNRRPRRRIETAEADGLGEDKKPSRRKKAVMRKDDPADNPAVPVKAGYWERIKIDKYCGQGEFEIKNSTQILVSMLSIFTDPPDYVNPAFVNRKMNGYYKRIEMLVTSVRSLLPRNSLKRNERLKKASPFAFSILDTLRYWNIDQISVILSRLQTRPRSTKVSDFTEILRYIYRPLYILERLDPEIHIKGAFKLLYKLLYLENPVEAKEKYQELIRNALFSYGVIRRDVRYQLYPMLLKLLSACWIPYESFFEERKNRLMAFLQLTEKDRINPQVEHGAEGAAALSQEGPDQAGAPDLPVGDAANEAPADKVPPDKTPADGAPEDEAPEDEALTEEERARRQIRDSENKALERGLRALETLFPKAGWDRIHLFPDFFPYFSDVFSLKKRVELIAPTDPLQQVYILTRIIEELFFGLRYTVFGVIMGPDGNSERIDEPMTRIINTWSGISEEGFDKGYLPKLDEYCRLLENTAESRNSNYAKRLINDLHWGKRLYFLPYYRFESIMPPPFQKNSIQALYPEARTLRRYLSTIAAGIEQGNKRGGAENRSPCDGVDNPWDPYVFQVPNPVSKRLDLLLAPKKRNNASLIYFTLAVTVVLDHLLNNEDSWAYERTGFLFRSENGEGIRPLFGVDTKIDTETIFKQALKKRQLAAAQEEAERKAADISV